MLDTPSTASTYAGLACACAHAAATADKHTRQRMAASLALASGGTALAASIPQLPPAHIVSLARALVDLNVRPGSAARDALATAALQHCRWLTLCQLSSVTRCVMVLLGGEDTSSQEAMLLLGELDTCMAMKVVGVGGIDPRWIYTSNMTGESHTSTPYVNNTMSPQPQLSSAPPAPLPEIQNLLLAHAAKQVPVPDILHAPLLNSISAQLDVAPVIDLCGSVLAVAQAKIQPDASLLRALLTRVSASQATPLLVKDASTLLKGLAMLCWTPVPSLLRQCIATLTDADHTGGEDDAPVFDPDVCWLFWGAAYFGVPSKDRLMQEAMVRWQDVLEERAIELTSQHAAVALWSFMYFKSTQMSLLQALLQRCGGLQSSDSRFLLKVYQALSTDNTGLVRYLDPTVARSAMVAWQGMRLEHEALVTDVMLTLKELKLLHYTQDVVGVPLLRLDFGSYRNIALLPISAPYCCRMGAAVGPAGGSLQHEPLGIMQVALQAARLRGLVVLPLSAIVWQALQGGTSAKAQYLLQYLIHATSPTNDNNGAAAPAASPHTAATPARPTAPCSSTTTSNSSVKGSPLQGGPPDTTGPHMDVGGAASPGGVVSATMTNTMTGPGDQHGPRDQGGPPLVTAMLEWKPFTQETDGAGVTNNGGPQGGLGQHMESALGSGFDSLTSGLTHTSNGMDNGVPSSMGMPMHNGGGGSYLGDMVEVGKKSVLDVLTMQQRSMADVLDLPMPPGSIHSNSQSQLSQVLHDLGIQLSPTPPPTSQEAIRAVQQLLLADAAPVGSTTAAPTTPGGGYAPIMDASSLASGSQQGRQPVPASPFAHLQLPDSMQGGGGASAHGGPGSDCPPLDLDQYGSGVVGLDGMLLSQLGGMRSSLGGSGAVELSSLHAGSGALAPMLRVLQQQSAGANMGWASSTPIMPSITTAMQILQQQQQGGGGPLSAREGGTMSMPVGTPLNLLEAHMTGNLDLATIKRMVLESNDAMVWSQLLCGGRGVAVSPVEFLNLLRELVDMQQIVRARQLFEWSQTLPTDHALRQLTTADQYGTLLMLCVQWQTLDHAITVLNDMHARNLQCGVRVYIALLRAANRTNRLEIVALIYKKMLLAPPSDLEPAPFHLMIEAYIKVERWAEAAEVLEDMDACGLQPDLQAYNTLLAALTKVGHMQQALQMYAELRQRGISPNVKTFFALGPILGPLSGNHADLTDEVDRVVLQDAIANPSVYSALLGSCEKAGQWTLAIHLLNRLSAQGCQSTKSAFNAVIAACAHAGEWRQAENTLQFMVEQGCEPDAVSYASMIRAYKKGGQWCNALFTFESMLDKQLTVHSAVHSSVIDLLWQTANPWAQLRAKQLFLEAYRNNSIPEPDVFARRNVVRVEVHALAPATALLAVQQWLLSLHEQLQQGMPSELLSSQKRVAVSNGDRSTRGGQSSMLTAIRQLLETPSSPFRYIPDPHSGRLEASTLNLKRWLLSPQFAMFSQMYMPENVPIASGKHGSTTSEYLAIETTLAQQAKEAYASLTAQERLQRQTTPLARLGMQFSSPMSQAQIAQVLPAGYMLRRTQLMQYVHQLTLTLGLSKLVAHSACMLMDYMMLSGMMAVDGFETLLAAACLTLMVQAEGIIMLPTPQLAALLQVDPGAMMALEQQIHLRWHHAGMAISAYHFLQVYGQRLDVDVALCSPMVFGRALDILEQVITNPDALLVPPSLLAAAVLCYARKEAGCVPLWPLLLSSLTGMSVASGLTSGTGQDLGRALALVEQWMGGRGLMIG